ncbi:secreted RxLR effector protein 161-like [Primulina eburnea]|uniref:secreted RxLR effector protein 161-like n=1 Tax=Primulina eburnea TaxID=1245227 RepID=UPI003C6CABB7
MLESKQVSTPIGQHFKLSTDHSPSSKEEEENMKNNPYANGVGSIMYSMVCSRPDLAYAMSVESCFMANPGELHWEALNWTMRYLKGTSNLGLMFRQQTNEKQPLVGFVDSDYDGNLDTRKSLTGFIFTLYGTAISWKATIQLVVALSTTEAEYVALTEGIKEAMWLK